MFVRVVCMFACECASKNVQDMRARKQTDFALLLTCAGVCTVFQQQSLRLAYWPFSAILVQVEHPERNINRFDVVVDSTRDSIVQASLVRGQFNSTI